MTKLAVILLQFLFCIGVLVSLILDIPKWEVIMPVRGLAFIILLVLAWNVLSHFFDELFARADSKNSETKALYFDDEAGVGYFDTNRQWRERGYHIEDRK